MRLSARFISACYAAAALAAFTAGVLGSSGAFAGPAWDGIKAEVYGSRALLDGSAVIKFSAPYRPDDVMAVPLAADVHLPKGEAIKSVSFIVDENPSPVAAVFQVGGAREHVALTTYIRLNQQSDVRVVVESASGELFMVEQLVKFAGGQASCSAPPQGSPEEIAANMGKMTLALQGPRAVSSNSVQRAEFELNHPNHTGMVLDQITLFYVPLLMVEHIEVKQGDDVVLTMAGSITMKQNPKFAFDYTTNGATEMTVTARDTSGAVFSRSFPIGPAS
jgi:sulfur-oxidizing protein SoxY